MKGYQDVGLRSVPLFPESLPWPYDADALIETLEERSIVPVIPFKANRVTPRKTDFALYRERNPVERFFNKIKGFRVIATRYDKLASTFLAAIHLVSALIWLN